jgi:ketosteroid isomerase-like protein
MVMTLLVALLAMVLVTGCGSDVDDEELEQVLRDQLAFLEAEDLEGALSTIHPESPQLAPMRNIMGQVFAEFDLDYEIESIEVVEKSDIEAKLKVVQVTRKVEGPELSDTRVTAIHTLRKTDGGWKLYDSVHESTEALN